jgi:hypothetical protein
MQGHIVTLVYLALIWLVVFFTIAKEGYFSILFFHISYTSLATALATVVFGVMSRKCYVTILPNYQGIQTFLGAQNGMVWGEGNFHFIPWPIWTIWRRISIEHISFTVAAQNRTKDEHQMMVFATGRAVPTNVSYLAKIPEQNFKEQLTEQLVGLAMKSVGRYMNDVKRNTLFRYEQWDISKWFESTLKTRGLFYGLDVTLWTTKVVEVNKTTMEQFDLLARQADMGTAILEMKKLFPLLSEQELYAAYASQVGLTPNVMSHMIHGSGANILLDGKGTAS